jgi:hyperosmotically inducible periplasmic protein
MEQLRQHVLPVGSEVRLGLFIVTCMLLTLVGGCSTAVEPGPSDAQLKRDVTTALDQANLKTVTSQVKDGVVTLTGTVPDQSGADNAVQIARSIKGVKDVISQVTLEPAVALPTAPAPVPQSPDELLGAKLLLALQASDKLAGAQIKVTVLNGVAMLTGKVPSDEARAAANQIATAFPGIASVEDKLEVVEKPVANVPDDQLEEQIQKVLDRSFPGLDLTMSVDRGRVVIRGAVRDRGQILQIAEVLRPIDGVRSVDTSLLTVEGGESGERIGSGTPPS